ncbi:Uso1 [Zalerion maritima]|uniref:Uso1 n=1 Tax=Zalerion maritima TaxID=339359 RepID=A0AAD5WW24_9PEZI|nr:Uso1 [Zalerion maritima]
MFSIASAPAKQSVSETITVLSGRLSSATLLEDRRAAILGLRSFTKEYPASVASGALRSLIGCLSKDGEDVDTVKVVLETLLMLFNPNEDSPEASEEIALWLADEFTMRQENITLLLDFLEAPDFYSRLYSLQLLQAILSARTERTEECIFTAPLGISRLVAVLDDTREAVRNEAITLLTFLTPTSNDIQKLVAFENAFDRLFNIIVADGGISEGSRTVEDCLILLANLLRLNSTNQSLFRESQFIPKISALLKKTYQPDDEEPLANWAQEQRSRNIYALLAVMRLFLATGAVGTPQNQSAFAKHGILFHALQVAFDREIELPIKAEALVTCADIIKGNPELQEGFAQLQVPSPLEVEVHEQTGEPTRIPLVYVIDGLLDLTLAVQSLAAFDIRKAACECLKAYFFNHSQVRSHFLRRAIEGHNSGADETANVLTTLLRPVMETFASDPYRHWFASCLMLHLLYENPSSKELAMGVTEGDEESGEEVVTSIQTITAHLVSGLNRGDDSRILVGYLMLLICWLFEDLDGVNDFLSEGSNIQGLITGMLQHAVTAGPIVQGLCAVLLAVVYEFSTKDSSIPRKDVQSILTKRLGREKYIDRLNSIRSHPLMRDYEVLPQRLDAGGMTEGKLPDVFFDATFVDFFKDNYSRLLRAIDRDPGEEIPVVTNGIQKGISREMVDALRAQDSEKERALQESRLQLEHLNQQLGQEQADHRRTKEASGVELGRIKQVNEALQRNHEHEMTKVKAIQERKEVDAKRGFEEQVNRLRAEQRHKEEEHRRQLDAMKRSAEVELERQRSRTEATVADLKATISRMEVDVMKANKAKTLEITAAKQEAARMVAGEEARRKEEEEKIRVLEKKFGDAEDMIEGLEKDLESKERLIEFLEKEAEGAEEKMDKLQREADGAKAELIEMMGELEGEKKKKGLQDGELKKSAGETLEKEARSAKQELSKAQDRIKEVEEEKQSTQGELDDLLMVFGDLEDKVEKYKKKLKDLGHAMSDDEEGDDEDEDSSSDGEVD